MREIKLRAWHKFHKKFIYYIAGQQIKEEDIWNDYLFEPLELFTELKDEDGNDIYENDIVACSVNEGRDTCLKQLVKWERSDIKTKGHGETYLNIFSGFDISLWPNNPIKKLGNIHENPELIEGHWKI